MKYLVIGAGMAGCAAAMLLKRAGHEPVVVERNGDVGGLCMDGQTGQLCGPHVLHTDDREVWDLLDEVSTFRHVDLEVKALAPCGLVELPRRSDPVFTVYSEKAWGLPWYELPESVRSRVPTLCTDGRVGYHAGAYKGIPELGWSALCRRMLDGIPIYTGVVGTGCCSPGFDRLVWTAPLDELRGDGPALAWAGRTWHLFPGALPAMQVNYCTHDVPQIRSWDNGRILPGVYAKTVGSEWYSPHGKAYPVHTLETLAAASDMKTAAAASGVILCGRGATYQYLDIDQTVRQVIDTLRQEGAIQ